MPSTITDRLNGLSTSVAIKAPCRVATTANITLSGTQTIDGVAVVAGDRVLVKNQTSAVDNGIWVCGAGTWARSTDFDGTFDGVGGTRVAVTSGTTNENSEWRTDGDGAIVIGTDSITWERATVSSAAFVDAGGPFTGSTIADDSTVEEALQALETAVEEHEAEGGGTIAVWDSGTTRTMKARATDTYCILDAPGSPDPTGNNSSNTALQAMMTEANSSGVRLELTIGDFVAEEPLLITRTGQVLYGHGMGYGYGRPDYAMRHFVGQSRIIASGTYATRIATRRKHRASGADPTDDAISIALDVQADGVTLSDFAIWLDTDWTDLTAGNYGDDVDVGLFVGCRPGFRLQNVGVFGHFRRHGMLFDVTRSLGLPELLDWDGVALPAGASGETFSGGDGTLLVNPFVYGPLGPSLAILGAINTGADYYDEATGAIADTRGASGFSDFECFGGRFYGAQHQSGRRTQDPTGYGGALSRSNMEAEADTFPASLYIDGWAGNSSSTTHGLGALRNMNFYGTRFTSCEAFRVRLGLCDQVKFLGTAWIEAGDSPSGTSSWKDTSGSDITIGDYTNVTYGHIATHQTNTGQVVAQDVVGGLVQTWVYSKQRTRATDGYGREMMQGLWVRGDSTTALPSGFRALSHIYDDQLGGANEYGGQIIESFRPFNYLLDRSSGNAMGWRYDTGFYQLRQGSHSAGSAPTNVLKTIKENGAEFTGEATIADDAVASITPPANGGYMMITFSPDTTGPQRVRSGIVFYDVGSSLDIGAVFAGANFATSTSDVTGTTGVDGNVTVAVQAGVIKIENRGGGSAVFRYTFLN